MILIKGDSIWHILNAIILLFKNQNKTFSESSQCYRASIVDDLLECLNSPY